MTLPLPRTYEPMEARLVSELPVGPQWQYEPKWDGFRCIAFRDGATVDLVSKAGKPLGRYFPDVVAALRAIDAPRFVVDGEIVVPVGRSLSFDELLLRIHPAASRVATLAREHPATFILFDLLVDSDGRALVAQPLADRRAALERFMAEHVPEHAAIRLSPVATRLDVVRRWFRSLGGGLDGVVAKRRDLPYQSGDRTGMVKLKHMRTADCVVGGFRYASRGRTVGSLLLGLYDDAGLLDHVGFCSNMKAGEKAALAARLVPLIRPPGFTGSKPGGPSRWSNARSAQWQPLAPDLVVEVQYDHFSGGRFRHGTSFVRWRPDKRPRQCTMEQVRQDERPAMKLLG
ncbi:MAG TPA: ATP-dependent DNA ligase [Gemmatimonadaceae bacterium]|nr:ATP-dependent DNA ligase [Gemmatimonadaceae bacterium]